MKNLKFTFLLIALLSMVGARALAHDIAVANADGVTIYYKWANNKTELSVSYQGSSYSSYPDEYSGNVVIPESVTYSGATYPVTSIGESTFSGCSGLTSITIPNSMTSIGSFAFSDCSGLTSVTIPSSVTTIGWSAFSGCSGLTSVTIPNSVTSIGNYAFYGCSGLTSVKIGNSVTSIGQSAFYGCSGLTSVTIPNSVTSIGQSAFWGCSGLTSVTIPNSVTSISESTFFGCSGLTSITIPNSVTSIGNQAFQGCSGLTIVKVPITDYSAFCNNKLVGLIRQSIGKPIMLIDDKGGEIKNFVIPDGVTSIGERAFYGCSGLTSVTISNSVTSIGSSAFSGCSSLTSVTIPNSVTSIGSSAFFGCSGLTSVTISNSVTSIRDLVFGGCSGLTSVTIPNSVTSIYYSAFEGCKGLTSVTISNSVTSIGSSAFSGCSSLTSVTIPNSVTSIGSSAFSGCSSLKNIILPISLQKIAEGAFRELKSLEDLYCYARVSPQLGNNIFENSLIGYATLHVPEKSLETYETTSPWSAFMKIVPLNDSDPDPSGSDFPGGGEGDQQCAKPTISYHKGKLNFYSATEGALCHYTISDSDITSSYGNEVQLTVTYSIMVFATKSGYRNSDAATATLCWIDVEPRTEGITNDIANIPANAVLIQSENGRISISGVGDGTAISVFGTNGVKVGSAVSHSGQAIVDTKLPSGSVAIVRIGNRSVKVVVK